jgi:ACS family hexuronate transporter-like MFS transporter
VRPAGDLAGAGTRRFGYRWTVLALLFAATTINYLDRQVLGILAPTLGRELGWTEIDYGRIVSWFSFAYGFGLLLTGRLFDWIGTRLAYSLSVIVWSLACMGHAMVSTVAGFSLARLALGLGEAGNFPGAVKTVAEWFPKKERAFATGIFNAGTNVGVVLAPVIVPWITVTWGWRWAFIGTGAIGFAWLAVWLLMYRDLNAHPRVSPAEAAYIRSDGPEATVRVGWSRLIRYPQTWAFIVGKSFTDPVWFFYLFWLPKFLDADFGVRLSALAAPLVVIYVVADFGSVGGGWLSSALIARGWSVNAGRKTALLAAALAIVPTAFAPFVGSMWTAVALVSVAAAAHQWWSCNLFTLVSDMFPRSAVASVVGMGGFMGAMSSMAFQRSTGILLEATGGNYTPIFLVCGVAYLAALTIIHVLVPRMSPAVLPLRA